MAKRIRILQTLPKDGQRFMIVPIGTYLNTELQEAREGCDFEVWQEWRRERYVMVRKAMMRINTPEFTFMLRHVYSGAVRLAELLERFGRWSHDSGAGWEGFDRERCLVVEIEPYIEIKKI